MPDSAPGGVSPAGSDGGREPRVEGGMGILGGTFNPPHVGHVSCARWALRQLGLERVLVIPVHSPPHKPAEDDPGPEHRLAMCRLAIEGEPRLEASALEVERAGPSYTVDTLRAIHADDSSARLTFIVGGDTALTLPEWREPEAVLSLARLAVAERSGVGRERIRATLGGLAGAERMVFLDMPPIVVSSSDVRARMRAGLPIAGLVPDGAARYIAEHRLYRGAAVENGTAPTVGVA